MSHFRLFKKKKLHDWATWAHLREDIDIAIIRGNITKSNGNVVRVIYGQQRPTLPHLQERIKSMWKEIPNGKENNLRVFHHHQDPNLSIKKSLAGFSDVLDPSWLCNNWV